MPNVNLITGLSVPSNTVNLLEKRPRLPKLVEAGNFKKALIYQPFFADNQVQLDVGNVCYFGAPYEQLIHWNNGAIEGI